MEENSNCHITGAEWEIMRVVWANEEVTSKFVSEVLGEKMNWKHATVKTLLNRLLEKNVLKKREKGNKYIYYTEYNEQEIAKEYVMETFNRICNRAVEEKRKAAVKKIPCNCLPGQCNCPEHQHEKKKRVCCSE